MKAALAVAAGLLGAPALADDTSLIAFMGGQGCTFGEGSRAAAIAAGHGASDIDALIAATLADGRAKQEGAYTVLNAATCTIRLPDIASKYSVTSPEITAAMTPVDAFVGVEDSVDQPGCFFTGSPALFDARNGGAEGSGDDDYWAFLGAGLISGDLRWYSGATLLTPPGYQSLSGDCADLPNIDAIRRSHAAFAQGFDTYVRHMGAKVACGDRWGFEQAFTIALQGGNPDAPMEMQPEVNAWLFVEFQTIATAAGWLVQDRSTIGVTAQPPACHYP